MHRTRPRASLGRSSVMRSPLGRRSLWPVIALVLLAASLGGCRRGYDISVGSLPPELKVLEGATAITARGDEESTAVEYVLQASYPADGVIAAIRQQVEAKGWKAAGFSLLKPTISSSLVRGWTYHFDGTVSPPLGVHQWQADWRNERGDVVTYSLRYTSADVQMHQRLAAPRNPNLQVTAFRHSSRRANEMIAAAKRASGA